MLESTVHNKVSKTTSLASLVLVASIADLELDAPLKVYETRSTSAVFEYGRG